MISRSLLMAVLAAGALATVADARKPQREESAAYRATQQGRILPLRQIESRVMPHMRGADYLGPELHGNSTYRLKFMRDGRVIWVDIDARTGSVIRRSDR